jgi:hypothetical protein
LIPFVATLALGLQPRQGLVKVQAKNVAWESHFMFLGVWESVKEWSFTLQMRSHFGNWSPDGFPNLQKVITSIKTHWIEKFLISLENSWNLNVQNGLTWPIWGIKYKLWPKGMSRVKLSIWLPITKSRESP